MLRFFNSQNVINRVKGSYMKFPHALNALKNTFKQTKNIFLPLWEVIPAHWTAINVHGKLW